MGGRSACSFEYRVASKFDINAKMLSAVYIHRRSKSSMISGQFYVRMGFCNFEAVV